jgi:ribosomal protein S18 acetylase RimI-like enzyme
MPEIELRPANEKDLPYLVKIDHSYQSLFVWQMDRVIQDGQININFRQTRLPRAVRVEYPGLRLLLNEENWSRYLALLVATMGQIPVGYIGLTTHGDPKSIWVTDWAVREDLRRRGIGTSLLLAAQEWAVVHSYRKILLEMQSKNYSVIQMARKLGYEFCGYNDHYFSSQDIALFFSRSLR